MQKVILKRDIVSNKAILGTLSINGKEVCKTLENPWLNNHSNISAIPLGTYKVKSYTSAKYPDVWEIQDVEGRSKILIHWGNFERNTQGCILVGKTWTFINEELAVGNSKDTIRKLRKLLDNQFTIDIIS